MTCKKPDRQLLGLSLSSYVMLLTPSFGSVQDEVAVEDVCKQIIKQWTDYNNQSKAKKDSDDGISLLLVFSFVLFFPDYVFFFSYYKIHLLNKICGE